MSLIEEPGWFRLERTGRVVSAHFAAPHRVVGTCGINGGLREDLLAVYNHQSCEPAGHHDRVAPYLSRQARTEHDHVCHVVGLDPHRTAALGTAADMARLGMSRRTFRGVQVVAACTAGVEGNAGRAGDPAGMVEHGGRYQAIGPDERPLIGTIVTMLFINHEVTPGALVRAVVTATEAKTAVLTDLQVGSRYSLERATGTGTDQITVAARLGDEHPLTGTGHHTVLGEMIGQTVREAVADALALQNGLTPTAQCSLVAQLGRFGLTTPLLVAGARRVLNTADADLFEANVQAIDHDPLIVAAAAALAAVVDQVRVGIVPSTCTQELVAALGGQLASAAAAGAAGGSAADFHDELHGLPLDPVELVPVAVALGHARKWAGLHERIAVAIPPGPAVAPAAPAGSSPEADA